MTLSSFRVNFNDITFVQGSFHQGDKRFQNTAGMQCTCCSLFSIVFSTSVKSPGHWKADDLDYIIENGDLVYKSLNTESYLMLTELPNNLCLLGSTLTVNYLENRFGFISSTSKTYRFLFKWIMTKSNGLLFMMKGLCISIIWNKKNYFLFDSHSRNSLGQTSPDGSSILLKFSSRKQLEYHIINNYLSEGDVNIQYEVQYIQIVKSNDGIDIKNVYRTLCEKRMHQTSQVRKENFKKIQNETEFQKEKTASSSRVDFYNSSVQGSFHQGDKRFQNTAGKQCTCCSLFSIVFSTLVKSPGHWKAEDLDYIIENGDLVYKSLNTESYLMLTELPTNLCLFESTLTVNYIENRFGFISATSKMYGFLFEKTMTESNGLLFMIKGLCISIIWNRNYFLFDSHSRNSLGQTSPDGSSILLKFSSRKQLESHIINNYLSESDVNIQYEVQYIQIVKSNDDIDIKNLYRILSERKRQTFRVRREKSRIHNASNIQKEKCILPNVSDIHKELKRKSMSTPVGRIKNKRKKPMVVNAEDSKDRVLSFKSAVQEGPCYICVVCNRSLYKRTTKIFCSENYDSSFYNLSTDISSFDDCKYICRTCHSHISKNQIPCQAVWNKLALDDLPDEMQRLNRLEKVLISKRILFKKISILPKGQQPKIKGAICNIPIDVESVSNCLPRATNNNGILFVKLKRKIEFRGHVYFESVRPNCIQEALEYLRQFNPFYSTILINMDNINSELLSLTDANAAVEKNEFSVTLENDEDAGILEVENPSDIEHTNSSEFCIIPNIYNESQNILSIAPGENKVPESFFKEDFCEEQAFPFLLPKGKFGYKVTRSVLLSPVKYFNQRLLNYTQRFASNGDYIFFAHYVMQQINLFNQINVATNKVKGTITAGQLKKNFKSTVRSFISEDKGYMFMKSVKGTPAYWKQFLYDVLAMVRQLGLPTLFFTLSCADLRWKELVLIIAKLNKLNIDECELNYFERCKILNQNPVLTARHFQFRVETFFKEIILHKKGPLGTVDSYVIKVEFQFRGSPHIHSFLWIRDAVQLTKETKDDYIKFVDSIVRADLPDEEGEPELHDLVKKFQIHCHSQSCRKYKNIPCRFHYGRFFTDRTICGEPLGDDISETEKLKILNKRSKLLKKVKAYIDEYLDPHKVTFSPDITIAEILTHLESTEEEYYSSLSIASAEDFEIHLRRPVNSCFVNNYLPIGLQAWEANMDIQPVFNYYKAVSYMCSYFSKCETESSIAMRKVSQESENLGYEDRMRKLAIAFLSHRQCSLQEAVFQVMPELWLRKTYPAVTFANSNFPEKRFRICKSEKEFLELSEDSTDVFKRNNLDRYIDRPNETFKKGKYKILNTMCYAEFLSYYVLDVNPQYTENDSQPEILNDDGDENDKVGLYPKSVPLMSTKERMKCRSVKKVLRYHVPNPLSNPEAYAHHLLMLFYSFRSESELLSSVSKTYMEKLNDENVAAIVNLNKKKFEPWGDLVDETLKSYTCRTRTDNFAEQENEDLQETFRSQNYSIESDSEEFVDFSIENYSSCNAPSPSDLSIISNERINALILSLNDKQRNVFNVILSWARKVMINLSSSNPVIIEPLYLFITGGAGTGKSHLIKTIYASVTKTLSFKSTINKPKILLLAPTGVAAVNISGTTIHSALGIPVDCRGLQVPKLSDKRRCSLRLELEDLKAIVIDEISMVSNKLLLYIHQRLIDIFGYSGNYMKPFAGITVVVVGDLYQLPPVLQRSVYADYHDELYNIHHLWRVFQMCELTEVMRQKGDTTFVSLLNNIRVGKPTENDIVTLKSRFIDDTSENYPTEAMHIFAENEPARKHNTLMLERINHPVITLAAIDQVPKGVPNHIYEKIKKLNQSQTKGLAYQLTLKIGSRVMLTTNIDISDRLINGQIGTVVHIEVRNDIIEYVFVKFNDAKAGRNNKVNNPLCRLSDSVLIERITVDIKTNTKKDTSPVIKRTQFPLTLSWACTVHKVQGLSMDQVIVSFDLLKQRSFNNGQMYVALSRVTSLAGLFLKGVFTKSAFVTDTKATSEYEHLREHQILDTKFGIFNECLLSLSICNVRSLKKHLSDIAGDFNFTSSDIILCTETQLETDGCYNINEYSYLSNNSIHVFSSLGAYYKSNKCDLVQEFKLDGFSIFKFNSKDIHGKLLLLYKKKDLPKVEFYETIQYLTNTNDIDIVTGDFNLAPNEQLNHVLNFYEQIVLEPTHIGGSILDHVYVRKSLLVSYDVKYLIKSVFFTDHECIKLNICKK